MDRNVVKRAQLSLSFEGRALDWYMRYVGQHADPSIQEIKNALKQQLRKPNSYAQLMVDLKYFRQGPTESVWKTDQWLKKVTRDGEF